MHEKLSQEPTPMEAAIADSQDAIQNPFRRAAVDMKTGAMIGVEDVAAHKA